MTDPAIVLRKLAALRDHVERLRRRRPATAAALRDVAMHFAADRGLGVPATYAEGFHLLAQHGVCEPKTSVELGKMAALRNRIAHGYASVDFARIWAELPSGLEALN